jgi:hypothetical protein
MVNLETTLYAPLRVYGYITPMTYSADVLIPANSSARTEGLGAFNDNGSGRFLTTATLPYTLFWNEHTLCVGFLIQCIHWELYKGIGHHSSVVLQKKNHHTKFFAYNYKMLKRLGTAAYTSPSTQVYISG